MKQFFENFLIFAIFAVVFSGGTACSLDSGGDTTAASNSGAAPASTPSSDGSAYPALATAISDAELRHLDGTTSKVADRKGKVLLLNMWATWCGPCRAEMPELVAMQDEYRDKNFEIIGLNTDDGDTKEMVEEFAADMNLNYTLVWAPTPMQDAMLKVSRFEGIPQSFVVDREGRLRGVFTGASPQEIAKMKDTVAKVVSE